MPLIRKDSEHVLAKLPTSIETAVPNTTYLERRISNRLVVGPIMPSHPHVGDVWKDTSRPTAVQKQCVQVDPTIVWDDLVELPFTIELSNIYNAVDLLEGLMHSLKMFYDKLELALLLSEYADGPALLDGSGNPILVYGAPAVNGHNHPAYADAVAALELVIQVLAAAEIDGYTFATAKPFIFH